MSDHPETELRLRAAELKQATDEVKSFAERANTEIKNLGTVTNETKVSADKALTEAGAIAARVTDLEQKIARRAVGGVLIEHKSIGHMVIENEEMKAALKQGQSFKGRVNVEVKNITSASTTGASATTGLVVADRIPGIIPLPNRPLTIRDLIAPGNTVSGAIDYVRETLFTNAAAPVAEAPSVPKPQSDLAFVLQNSPVRTLAHWMKASKQIMDDAPQLQSYIDGRLRYGLSYVEDQQLLLGDGTGSNLLGMMPQASAYAAPAGVNTSNPTTLDKLRLAMLQAYLALFPATGHILHPSDWAQIELLKDTQGRYIFANPQGLATPTLWGLPVAQSLAMPQNSFLTGAFKFACQIFDREDANVLISTEDGDNFVKNMVTILAEQRLAFVVTRPQALIKGLLTV